nr:uncharacterized protein LOC111421000 [Onthophagus taurus]
MEIPSPSKSSNPFTASDELMDLQTSTPSEEDVKRREAQVIRFNSTMGAIQSNSKFYLGLPKEIFEVVHLLSERAAGNIREIFIVLKKIKLNDPFTRISIDFGVSAVRIHQIFTEHVPKIATVLQNLIFWPTPRMIKRTTPIPFRRRYSKVQSIIDCFEIEIEKPSNPLHQSLTWSEYKKCNTVKYLLSCCPNGFINFVSKGYAGRASDKEIVQKSQFLNKLPEQAWVMADRGFKHIVPLLLKKKCTLVRPPSVSADVPSTSSDVMESKRIASLRIHVERVIQRIREFNLLICYVTVLML